MLLAVLEIEGPDTIRIKKGADAGKEVSVLKLLLGDEEGCICKLTAWREVAEVWGGVGDAVGVKKGDVLYFDSMYILFTPRNEFALDLGRCDSELGSEHLAHANCISVSQIESRDML
jgi:hypothetical protein